MLAALLLFLAGAESMCEIILAHAVMLLVHISCMLYCLQENSMCCVVRVLHGWHHYKQNEIGGFSYFL